MSIPAAFCASAGPFREALRGACDRWAREDKTRRLWRRDASLWTDQGEDAWLGWLDAPAVAAAALDAVAPALARARESLAARDIVVLGMGGSSLFPDVLSRTFEQPPGAPALRVLDSTDPDQIRAMIDAIDLEHSLFVYASKSGSTIEPATLQRMFWQRLTEQGAASPGAHFVAVTDPGTALDRQARRDGYAAIAHGEPSIGGRFSALSPFGLVPAELAGLDTGALLAGARAMAKACGPDVAPEDNPGVWLGLLFACAARSGRDKLTLLLSPAITSFGGWLEQLLAESSGKHGHGLVAVDGEALAEPARYGGDRIFVYLRLATEPAPRQDDAAAALEAAGHCVVTIDLESPSGLGAEVFRWQVATAVACAELGVNAFDQPDVEAAKVVARALLDDYEAGGEPPAPTPLCDYGEIAIFAESDDAGIAAADSLEDALAAHLGRLNPGDYFALNAFVPMNADSQQPLDRIRNAVFRATSCASTLGYGPRFLHSTGQLHKGGPDSGVFLVVTADPARDLEIPGQRASFALLEQAQALGDCKVLGDRGRRVLRVHLSGGATVLASLADAVDSAVARLHTA